MLCDKYFGQFLNRHQFNSEVICWLKRSAFITIGSQFDAWHLREIKFPNLSRMALNANVNGTVKLTLTSQPNWIYVVKIRFEIVLISFRETMFTVTFVRSLILNFSASIDSHGGSTTWLQAGQARLSTTESSNANQQFARRHRQRHRQVEQDPDRSVLSTAMVFAEHGSERRQTEIGFECSSSVGPGNHWQECYNSNHGWWWVRKQFFILPTRRSRVDESFPFSAVEFQSSQTCKLNERALSNQTRRIPL